MKRYVVDFEFETDDGQLYWLPLGFEAVDGRKAKQVAERIEHGLRQKFKVERNGPYAQGTYSGTLLAEMQRGHRKGEPAYLELLEHKLRKVEFDPQLSFEEHMELEILASSDPYPDEPTVIGSMKKRQIPVRLVREGDLEQLHSLLVINVISPDVPDRPKIIPAESIELGSVEGQHFRATIYQTPNNKIAASVDISEKARQLQLDADRMNIKIWEKSVELTGDQPDYYVTRRVKF